MKKRGYEVARGAAIARVASLPIERAVEVLAAEDSLEAARVLFAGDVVARTAVSIASPSMARALEDWIAGEPLRNPKLPLRALCYLLRMAARTTPFGLFAGAGEVTDGEGDLELNSDDAWRSYTRVDMGVLGALIAQTEKSELRDRIAYVANDAAFVRGGRLYVVNVEMANQRSLGAATVAEQRDVSLRYTKAVRFVRESCSAPQTFAALVVALCAEFGASEDESRHLLERLIEAGVVISELRASPIGDPAAYLLQRLEGLGSPAASLLREATSAAAVLDDVPIPEQRPADYAAVASAFSQVVAEPPSPAIQVDLRAMLHGALPASVYDDAELLVESVARCGRVYRLRQYRERFLERYEGYERLVPLLELVDNECGLGAPGESDYEPVGAARRAALVHLFSEAARSGAEEIVLDGTVLDTVLPQRADGASPRSIEAGFTLAARSPEALRRGDYRMVATMLSDCAGKFAGRFAGMLGDGVAGRLRETAARSYAPGDVVAEFSYLPVAARSYNVCIRPLTYDFEIRAGIGAPPAGNAISLQDLFVGLDGDRFYLWSQSLQRRVTVRETHALMTAFTAPNLCRFLALVSRDGLRVPEVDLEGLEELTYLPRLRRERVVLAPRRWTFPRTAFAGDAAAVSRALERTRERWNMPRYVYLCAADNRLLLDLDAAVTGALLLDQAGEAPVALEEAIPAPDEHWLRGPSGTHAAEFVVSAVAVEAPAPAGAAPATIVTERKRFGPGSEWTYLKLYLGRQAADDFIVSTMMPLVRDLRANGEADGWFFLRYQDAAYHLRLRLHAGVAGSLRESALSAAQRWLEEGKIDRYVLDTYEPEYERYGGSDGVARAESFFDFDSGLCAALLAGASASADARVELAAGSFDAMMRACPGADDLAVAAYAAVARAKLETPDRDALRRINERAERCDRDVLSAVLAGPGAEKRLASMAHMHCNRLGIDVDAEVRVAQLLRSLALSRRARTRETELV